MECIICRTSFIKNGTTHFTCSPKCYIESHVERDPGENGCWVWTGSRKLHREAIGQANWLNKVCGAPKFSYETFKGPVPKGKLICHTCDRPACVNPKHLKLGDNKINSDDKIFKQRHNPSLGEKNGCALITAEDAIKIYNAPGVFRSIAEKFGISNSTVKDIKHGRTWWHATGHERTRKVTLSRTIQASPLDFID